MGSYCGFSPSGRVESSCTPGRRPRRGAHGLDQIVHRSCRQALDICLLNDGRHRLFRGPPGLQELGKIGALAQLQNLHVDPRGPRCATRRLRSARATGGNYTKRWDTAAVSDKNANLD